MQNYVDADFLSLDQFFDIVKNQNRIYIVLCK